jgi:2,5-dioxopentanoate dehydrogenase
VTITGETIIGASLVRGAQTYRAIEPATGATLDPPFSAASAEEVERACALAWAAFPTYRETSREDRAKFLETIAENIVALGDELIVRTMAESGLPRGRLEGERGRTVGQLRLFAQVVRQGDWLGARIDPALPERKPLPRPDLRLRRIPLGPVAVFGASNFPLAFSVAGGDTASAFAAGCPVVVKGHPAHPGASEMVGRAIQQAVKACGLPEGVFSLVGGVAHELSNALVAHPHIKAVGFTGSRGGGLARAEALGQAYIGSLTLGSGQFCTNPGLIFAIAGEDLTRFVNAAETALAASQAQVMLTPGIHKAFEQGVAKIAEQPGVTTLARGADPTGVNQGKGALFETDLATFTANPNLAHEVFGVSSIVIRCPDADSLVSAIAKLEGQLTATLHLDQGDHALAGRLLPELELKAGRILANGWPTGVEVAHAMVHGGPFPATSDSRTTSVGTYAIDRFLRPVCYQDIPQGLLPDYLRDGDTSIRRLVDGAWN